MHLATANFLPWWRNLQLRIGLYGDRSYTLGILSADTITLDSTSGRPVRFPSLVVDTKIMDPSMAKLRVSLALEAVHCLLFLKWILQSVENSPTV
jgi:hypothetical protein